MKTKVIQVSKNSTRYVNVGIMIDDELFTFEINFLSNTHTWGVTVINPGGKSVTELAEYGSDIYGVTIDFENVTLSFSVFDNVKSGMYEIYFEE